MQQPLSLHGSGRLLGVVGLAAAVVSPTKALDPAATLRVTYKGWNGCYRIAGENVDLVFVAQIGRIMRYGRIGGPNVLWENTALAGTVVPPDQQADKWINYGGDKLWPAPQERWNWPPDPTLDRGTHTVEVLGPRRLRLTGSTSPRHGLRFTREIEIDKRGTEVRIRNTMTNTGDRPAEWSVWEVAQVNDPQQAWLPTEPKLPFPEAYMLFRNALPEHSSLRAGKGSIIITRHPTRGAKIGSPSREGWAAAKVGNDRFRVSCKTEKGARYPDSDCVQEIWSNPDPNKYMELELLGPLRTLTPGQSTRLVTVWDLTRSE